MPKFFVEEIEGNVAKIKGVDVNHIQKVLRKKLGDTIEICDKTKRTNYISQIVEMTEMEIVCKILKKIEEEEKEEIAVTIFQGLPKAEKMEWIIQKSVELGAFEISPVEMKRCVVKIDEKAKAKKIERWQKIAEAAAKQCGRNDIPRVLEISNIKQVAEISKQYDAILLAYEQEQNYSIKQAIEILKEKKAKNLKIGIVIGPEGGLEEGEVNILKEAGAKVVTLGKRILRTETVSLAVLSILMYELGTLN